MKSDSRRKFMKNGFQVVLVLLLAPQLIACKGKSEVAATAVMNEELKKLMDFSISGDESYQIRNLAGNLWTFEERGGTIGFDVSDDGIAIVDTQFPEQSQHLVDAIREQTDRSIDLLINTHHHGDHTSGNNVFKKLIKDSVAHSNSKKNQLSRAEGSDKVDQIFFPETVF